MNYILIQLTEKRTKKDKGNLEAEAGWRERWGKEAFALRSELPGHQPEEEVPGGIHLVFWWSTEHVQVPWPFHSPRDLRGNKGAKNQLWFNLDLGLSGTPTHQIRELTLCWDIWDLVSSLSDSCGAHSEWWGTTCRRTGQAGVSLSLGPAGLCSSPSFQFYRLGMWLGGSLDALRYLALLWLFLKQKHVFLHVFRAQ